MDRIEFGLSIKSRDEDGNLSIVTEGDEIVCYTKDGKEYNGRLMIIGYYRENETADPENAICVHWNTGDRTYSGEYILLKEIAHIRRAEV